MSDSENDPVEFVGLKLESELLREIDALAGPVKGRRSEVLRNAIRAGLPLLKAGGAVDTVQLDGETRMNVDNIVKIAGCSRERALLEAIRYGTQEAYWKLHKEKLEKIIQESPERSEDSESAKSLLIALEHSQRMNSPRRLAEETGKWQSAASRMQLYDILQHVPEAAEWYDLRMKHWQLTRFWVQIGDLTTEKLRAMVAEEERKKAQQTIVEFPKSGSAKKPRKPTK